MTPSTSTESLGHSRRWARWGLLLTTLALALALLGSAWAGYRSARGAVDALERAQAEMLAGDFRGGPFGAWQRAQMGGDAAARAGSDPAGPPRPPAGDSASTRPFGATYNTDAETSAGLDSVVVDRLEAGLRWVGFVSADGTVLVSGGEALDEPFRLPVTQDGPALIRGDERTRAYFTPPGEGRFLRPVLVLEFEPVIARAMVASAVRSLALAAIVAGILTLAGLMFWRISVRFEAAEREMEQRKRLSVLGEMSAVLAHEIRNPLASLKGHSQLLVERLVDAPGDRRKAERVVGEATRLEALTTDLLDFAGSGPLQLEEIDPVELVRQCTAEAAPGAGITVLAPSAPARWPLDALRLQRALANLIRNAAQASPPEAPPEVTVAAEGGRLVVVVRDHGDGLPAGQEERIFDPFFTTRTTGTGLGLAVAKRIAEMHGGTLSATNAPEGGAVFRLDIPRRG